MLLTLVSSVHPFENLEGVFIEKKERNTFFERNILNILKEIPLIHISPQLRVLLQYFPTQKTDIFSDSISNYSLFFYDNY